MGRYQASKAITTATVGNAKLLLLSLWLFAEFCDGSGRMDGVEEAVVENSAVGESSAVGEDSAVGVTWLSCSWGSASIL